MNQDPETPFPHGHPLSGVLDRLLARERGSYPEPTRRPMRKRPTVQEAPAAPSVAPAERRMLVIAALGADGGAEASRRVVRWALEAGRHPAVVDIGNPDGLASLGNPADSIPANGHRVPLANLPATPESLKDQPAEILAALLERLRRHESSADLLVVRVAPDHRMALMRAAFLAGGLVLPVENCPEVLHEALRLSRELLENFLDVTLWPFPSEPEALDRYRTLMQEFLGADTVALDLDPAQAAETLGSFPGPPQEGFLVSLVDPDTPSPPAQLLQFGTLRL